MFMRGFKLVIWIFLIITALFFWTQESNAQTLLINEQTGISTGVACALTDFNFNFITQTFRFPNYAIQPTSIEVYLRRSVSAPTGNATLYLTDSTFTTILGQQSFDMSILTIPYQWISFDLSAQNIILEKDQTYGIYLAPDNNISPKSIFARYATQESYQYGNVDCKSTGYNSIGDMVFKVFGYPYDHRFSLFNIAYAAECTLVSSGATTTATCTDPIVENPTSNLGTSLILFFIAFFGLLFYFKKGGD